MSDIPAVLLGIFLILVGVAHFLVPRYFASLVPPWLPQHRGLVLLSGAAEIVIGIGLLITETRQLAGVAATALLALYVLTHVDALVRASASAPRWLDRPAGAAARVVVNLGYLAWAGFVAVAS